MDFDSSFFTLVLAVVMSHRLAHFLLFSATLGPNAANIHQIADLYAEVLGVLAQSRFLSIKRKFFSELREYREA